MGPESWRDRWKSQWPKPIRAANQLRQTIEALETEVVTLKQSARKSPRI